MGINNPPTPGSGGFGTVTSVNVSGGTTGLTTSGGPVTSTGTVTLAGTVNETHGGTNQTAYTKGDILVSSASNTLAKLAIGANGTILTADSTATNGLAWEYPTILQNSKSADYTFALTDMGGSVYHPSADTSARTWTIPANASVTFPIGSTITLINDTSAGIITLAITSDTLVFAGSGATGSRAIAPSGMATITKMTSTRWMISGVGVT